MDYVVAFLLFLVFLYMSPGITVGFTLCYVTYYFVAPSFRKVTQGQNQGQKPKTNKKRK